MAVLNKIWISLVFAISVNTLSSLEQADQSSILEIIQSYADAWNLREGKGFGDGFTEDANFVNIYGMIFSGRAEIEERHVKILQGFLKDSKIEILNTQLREVHPGLVIALVRWRLEGYRNPGSNLEKFGEKREGVFTHVFINENSKWAMTATQNTLIPK